MIMKKSFDFGIHKIGEGLRPFVIAELSANHGHDLDKALQIVRAAAEAGADAVKLQTYTADTLTIDCDKKDFRVGEGTLWAGRTLYDLYSEAYTPWEWHEPVKDLAESFGMEFFSTPFDPTAVDFLESLGVKAYKVASFELVDVNLLRLIAGTGKPVIMSTGMANLDEIREAVAAIHATGNSRLALLKCTSGYPSRPEEMNLRAIPVLCKEFGLPVGLSDHTLTASVPAAAVALGACIIEKHITLSRADGGPDAAFSLEPMEFRQMVDAVQTASQALGKAVLESGEQEAKSRAFRRSLYAVENICAGESFTAKNLRSIRPAFGLHPRHLESLTGRKAAVDIERGTALAWDHVEEGQNPCR
jgi:N-acetylneuraminate synthase